MTRALTTVVVDRETKEIVVSAVRTALAGTKKHLGVSRNWLTQQVYGLSLTVEEIDDLVSVRTSFGGSLRYAVKLMRQGLTAEDICGCYQTRNFLREIGLSASVMKLAKLSRTFKEIDLTNEGIGEMILDAHEVVSANYSWVKYVDQTINVLCMIAESFEVATIEGALAMVEVESEDI